MLGLRADSTHRLTVVTVVVVPVPVVGVEVKVVRVVGVVRVLRTRPVVAVGASVVEVVVPAIASGREETQHSRLPSDTDIRKERFWKRAIQNHCFFLGLLSLPRQAAYEFANLIVGVHPNEVK